MRVHVNANAGDGQMKSGMQRGIIGAAMMALALLAAPAVFAQESADRVAANTDWSVFNPSADPALCFMASAPKETVNTRDGKKVDAKRGSIVLYVTYRKGGDQGVVSFAGGYPFADKSTVKLTIDGKSFEMFTDGEHAWSNSPAEDAQIIGLMKAGKDAVAEGRSGRGTKTRDSFSLLGFSASLSEAQKRCGN